MTATLGRGRSFPFAKLEYQACNADNHKSVSKELTVCNHSNPPFRGTRPPFLGDGPPNVTGSAKETIAYFDEKRKPGMISRAAHKETAQGLQPLDGA